MRARNAGLIMAFLGLTYLFGGRYGLIAGLAIVVAWRAMKLRPAVLWAASVAMLAAAPVALMAQGLPRTPVAGPSFGTSHLVAHMLVGLAMAMAVFAVVVGWIDVSRPRHRRSIRRADGPPPDAP